MGKKKTKKQLKKERIQYLINEEKKEEERRNLKRAKRKERQMDIDDGSMYSSRKRRKYEFDNSRSMKVEVSKPKKVSEVMDIDLKSSEPKPKSIVFSLGFDEAKLHNIKELIEETKGKTMKRKRSNSIKLGKFMSDTEEMETE